MKSIKLYVWILLALISSNIFAKTDYTKCIQFIHPGYPGIDTSGVNGLGVYGFSNN